MRVELRSPRNRVVPLRGPDLLVEATTNYIYIVCVHCIGFPLAEILTCIVTQVLFLSSSWHAMQCPASLTPYGIGSPYQRDTDTSPTQWTTWNKKNINIYTYIHMGMSYIYIGIYDCLCLLACLRTLDRALSCLLPSPCFHRSSMQTCFAWQMHGKAVANAWQMHDKCMATA